MTTTRFQVAVTGDVGLSGEACALLEAGGAEVRQYPTLEPEALAEVCRESEALITFLTPVTARVIAAMTRCRIVARLGVGYDSIDLVAAREAGIPVTNVPHYCTTEVADHSLALALALARGLPFLERSLRQGEWLPRLPYPIRAFEEMTFGAVGFGRIGRATLERARAFRFRLAACDPFVSEQEMESARVIPMSLERLLQEADIVSLHVPLTPDTRHLLDTRRLTLLRPDALLVNTARGALVDTVALAEALWSGRLAAAGIDVFEEEPVPPSHPLHACPNAILTPHYAWHSALSDRKLHLYGAEEVLRALRQEPLHHVVNGTHKGTHKTVGSQR